MSGIGLAIIVFGALGAISVVGYVVSARSAEQLDRRKAAMPMSPTSHPQRGDLPQGTR
jgi:hypothetical protein